jgi:hypothetical protein
MWLTHTTEETHKPHRRPSPDDISRRHAKDGLSLAFTNISFTGNNVPSILGNHRVIMIAFKAQRGVLAERSDSRGKGWRASLREPQQPDMGSYSLGYNYDYWAWEMHHHMELIQAHLRSVGVREDQGRNGQGKAVGKESVKAFTRTLAAIIAGKYNSISYQSDCVLSSIVRSSFNNVVHFISSQPVLCSPHKY